MLKLFVIFFFLFHCILLYFGEKEFNPNQKKKTKQKQQKQKWRVIPRPHDLIYTRGEVIRPPSHIRITPIKCGLEPTTLRTGTIGNRKVIYITRFSRAKKGTTSLVLCSRVRQEVLLRGKMAATLPQVDCEPVFYVGWCKVTPHTGMGGSHARIHAQGSSRITSSPPF